MPSAQKSTTPVGIDLDFIEGRYAEVGRLQSTTRSAGCCGDEMSTCVRKRMSVIAV